MSASHEGRRVSRTRSSERQLGLDLDGTGPLRAELEGLHERLGTLQATLDKVLNEQLLLGDRLWGYPECALYFKVSENTARRMLREPGAPRPIRLPSGGGNVSAPRYVAAEIRKYAERTARVKRPDVA